MIDTVEIFGSIQEAYKNRSGIPLIIFSSLPESMDTQCPLHGSFLNQIGYQKYTGNIQFFPILRALKNPLKTQ